MNQLIYKVYAVSCSDIPLYIIRVYQTSSSIHQLNTRYIKQSSYLIEKFHRPCLFRHAVARKKHRATHTSGKCMVYYATCHVLSAFRRGISQIYYDICIHNQGFLYALSQNLLSGHTSLKMSPKKLISKDRSIRFLSGFMVSSRYQQIQKGSIV